MSFERRFLQRGPLGWAWHRLLVLGWRRPTAWEIGCVDIMTETLSTLPIRLIHADGREEVIQPPPR